MHSWFKGAWSFGLVSEISWYYTSKNKWADDSTNRFWGLLQVCPLNEVRWEWILSLTYSSIQVQIRVLEAAMIVYYPKASFGDSIGPEGLTHLASSKFRGIHFAIVIFRKILSQDRTIKTLASILQNLTPTSLLSQTSQQTNVFF